MKIGTAGIDIQQPAKLADVLTVHIVKRFDGKSAFELKVSAEIGNGITVIFGPSGAGKTTLLECIAGLLTPTAGKLGIGARQFFDDARRINMKACGRKVGYVFQDLALFPHLTVEKNIAYGIGDLSAETRKQKVAEIIQSFEISGLQGRKPDEISGGERQRVALARALVTDPCLLLLDEPLAALDTATKSRIIGDLRKWNDAHRIPVLYVTHSREEVYALGDRVLILEGGRVVGQGPPQEVLP